MDRRHFMKNSAVIGLALTCAHISSADDGSGRRSGLNND